MNANKAKDAVGELDPLDVIDLSLFGQMFAVLRKVPASQLRTPYQPWQIQYVCCLLAVCCVLCVLLCV